VGAYSSDLPTITYHLLRLLYLDFESAWLARSGCVLLSFGIEPRENEKDDLKQQNHCQGNNQAGKSRIRIEVKIKAIVAERIHLNCRTQSFHQ
jgi:hypothetical protein